MKVVDFNDSSHTISMIPRYDVSGDLNLYLYKESDETETTFSVVTYTYTNGIMEITFTHTFTEDERYQLKVATSGGTIAYRGKLIATDQTPEDYILANDLYFYE